MGIQAERSPMSQRVGCRGPGGQGEGRPEALPLGVEQAVEVVAQGSGGQSYGGETSEEEARPMAQGVRRIPG